MSAPSVALGAVLHKRLEARTDTGARAPLERVMPAARCRRLAATWAISAIAVLSSRACAERSSSAVSDCAQLPIWPLPQHCEATVGHGRPLRLDGNFTIEYSGSSRRLRRAIRRYSTLVRYTISNVSLSGEVKTLRMVVDNEADAYPGWGTNTNHTVTVSATEAVVEAGSIYGAMYGMETFAQLTASGALDFERVMVNDWAARDYRSLMIDTGRRFFPPSLVRGYLDAMSYAKMSVLHMHLTDEFRWSVESTRYPALTSHLEPGEFYTQAELRSLIDYAADRGIRLVPEVDVPAHSNCMQPLEGTVVFCSDTHSAGHPTCSTELGSKCPPQGQLYDDPANKTIGVVLSLLSEVASIFAEEPLFHMGGDETLPMGACSKESIGGFYAKVLNHLASLGKTPAAWQEVLWGSFGSKDMAPAATIPKDTVFEIALDTAGHWDNRPVTCGNLTAHGSRCINSLVEHTYLDICGGTANMWFDLDVGLPNPTAERSLVGGEVCLWSHLWCPGYNTGPWGSMAAPQMFDEAKDMVFAESAMRWTWPRTAAAAGAFWHYDKTLSKEALLQKVSQFNVLVLQRRGVLSCPDGCDCQTHSFCNMTYLA